MSWTDTVSKIGEIVVGLGNAVGTVYSNVVIGQATAGYFDSMSNMNIAQIDSAMYSINEQKKAQELAKQITAINGKMKNGLTLTEDEYMFMINNGYLLSDYQLNDDGTATKVYNDTDLKLTGLSAKGYLTLGAVLLTGFILFKRILR